MARFAIAGIWRSTGSEYMRAPAGIDTDDRPLNANGRPDAGRMAAPLSWRARCAAPIARGIVPKALLKTTRARLPPALTWTICRSVWLLKFMVGSGGGPGAIVMPGGGAGLGAG